MRTRRTPEETAKDIADEGKVVNALAKDREGRAKGGRIGRAQGGSALPEPKGPIYGPIGGPRRATAHLAAEDYRTGPDYQPGSASSELPNFSDRYRQDNALDRANGGRANRAHGGRTKGKTTVNVIIGGQKALTPPAPPPPPPMAAPGPVGPPKPPMMPPGMPPGGGMPIGGAPLGPMGAPPPGAPPMLRARGGRIGKQWGGGMPMAGQQQSGMGGQWGGQRPWGQQPPAGGSPPPAGGWPQAGQIGQGIQQAVQQWRQAHPDMGGGATPPTPPQGGWGQGGQSAWGQQQGHGWGHDGDWGDHDGRGGWGGHHGMGNDHDADGQTGTPSTTATDTWAERPPPGQTAQTGMGDGRQWGRARGGRIEIGTPGVHTYPKPEHGKVAEKFGGGSGLGRQERARRQK